MLVFSYIGVLLLVYQSKVCHSIQALNQTGSLKPKNIAMNSSDVVSLTCSTICGSITWHINGQIVETGSLLDEHYRINQVSARCSESFDPERCPRCGCSNCNKVTWPTVQTYTSTLSLTANKSLIVDCVSEQHYPHRQFSILRKRFNINVFTRVRQSATSSFILSTTTSAVHPVPNSMLLLPTSTPTCTCSEQPQIGHQSLSAHTSRSSLMQKNAISESCKHEIAIAVLSTTLVFASLTITVLVCIICERRGYRKS